MAEDKKPFHERVAEKIIDQLKAGTAPWQKPWNPAQPGADAGSILPINPTTGKRYRGVNIVNLMSEGYDDNRWMTYKQASGAGAQVRKGEKGTLVQYWKFDEEQTLKDAQGKPVLDGEGKPQKVRVELERPRPFYAVVFNAEQIDGLPPRTPPAPLAWNPIERAEGILKASGAEIFERAGNRAFYAPALDAIQLPQRSQFDSADRFYATALHELGHWTGHPSRLDRDLAHPFGSEGYAKEELRAEIASLIMGEELRIGHDPEQHVAYVASWIKTLEDDPMEIVRACSDAEKINTFVMAFEQKLTQQQDGQDLSAASPSPDRPPAMDVPIAAVLDDPDTDRSHYRAYNHSYDPAFGAPHERLEAALVDAGFTRIGQVVGDDSRDWGSMWETAIERLSPVFGIAPDYEHMGNAYLERKGLAEDFATMGEVLIQNPDRAHELIATYSAAREATAATVPHGNPAEQDTPINVPFREKNEAKAQGAKWDKEGRTWFVPAGTDLTPFAKWSQEAPSAAVEAPQAEPATPQPERPAQTTSDEQERQSMADRPRTSKQPTGRQFLAVPYGERHVAKAAGARWDQAAKSWYAPPNSDPAKFARWKPENQPNRQAEAVTPDKEFADAMKALGLEVPQGHPMMDGKTHRVPAVGDGKGEAAGFYVGHLDGHPAGYIKNNRSGLDMRWKSAGYSLTEEERARLNAEAAIKREAREREQAATHEETASKVQRRAAGCQQITSATPYMVKKGVQPTTGALTDGRDGTIHLPAIDVAGKHWTTQYIQEDGTKRFAKDSHKEGCFHVVDGGRTPAEALAALAAAPRLMIGEGYATMNTIGSVVGHPTVSAFDSGNLPAVAKALHERFPDKPIFIVGEDDKRVQERFGYNPGKEKATEAAKLVDGKPLFPVFAPAEQEADPKRFTDFNDLAMNSSLGREGLERQVKAAVENPRAQALPGPRLRVDEETPQQRRSGPAIGDEQPAQRRGVRL